MYSQSFQLIWHLSSKERGITNGFKSQLSITETKENENKAKTNEMTKSKRGKAD